MATIYDVAKAAKVSIATVSRAMADKPNVAQNTRLRVLQAAKALGWSPNATAQALALLQGK